MGKVTILIGGKVPTKVGGTVIACDDQAAKKKAAYHVFVDKQDCKVMGSPKVCCAGHLKVVGALHIRTTHSSWDSSANLALALASYLRADQIKVVGLDTLDDEAREGFNKEVKILWPAGSPLT